MKTKFIIASILSIVLFSCSKDNGSTPITSDNGDSTPTTYMPLSAGNYWNYNVPDGSSTPDPSDHLSVLNDVTINSLVYKKMDVVSTPTSATNAYGFYSNMLKNNSIRVNGSSIVETGTFNFSVPVLSAPIAIALTDFKLFKENATSGDVLSTITGVTHQIVPQYSATVPLDISYTLKSVADQTLTTPFTYTSNSINYSFSNVKTVKIILNIKVTATTTIGGIPATVTLLADQPALTSTQYYAKGKGMVSASNHILVDIDPTILTGLGLPSSLSHIDQTQNEYLTTFQAN